MKSLKQIALENSFDGAPGGHSGTLNYAPPLNTHASPASTQYPDRFAQQSRNRADQQTGGSAGGKGPVDDMPVQKKLDGDVDKIFSKKDTPTPDEISSAIQYELGRMISKNKGIAKQTVLANMKKDPHFYSNLHMLNIDDKKMKVDESIDQKKKAINNIFQELVSKREKKYEVKPELANLVQDMWRKKQERSMWKQGLTSEAPS